LTGKEDNHEKRVSKPQAKGGFSKQDLTPVGKTEKLGKGSLSISFQNGEKYKV